MGCKQCKIFATKPTNSAIFIKQQNSACFDDLPVELIYHIFDQLDTLTILTSLYNVSKRLNAMIRTYNQYDLNFKSISRKYFHRICSILHPEQIISLTLSDGNDTVGLVEYFLQKYSLTSFQHLKSLTLRNIDDNEQMIKIFLSLPHQLEYLSIENNEETYDETVFDIFSTILTRQTLTKLYLDIDRNRILTPTILWPNQCYLTELILIGVCNLSLFRMILLYSLNLKKIQVDDIDFDDENDDDEEEEDEEAILPIENASNIISLSFVYARTQFDKLDWFLRQFHSLQSFQYFNLDESYCDNDWSIAINGNHWQDLLVHCQQFQMILTINHSQQTWNIQEYISTFQTHFWQDKNWQIALEQHDYLILIYTLPYPYHSYCYTHSIVFSLPTNHSLLKETMQNVTKLRIHLNAINHSIIGSPRFFHVSQIILDGQWRSIDLIESISSLVCLSKVTKFVRLERVPTLIFRTFLDRLINLKSLTLTTSVLNSLNAAQFQYRTCLYTLTILQFDDQTNNFVHVEPFCTMFSRIEHVDLPIDTIESCQYLIERLGSDLISIIFRFSNDADEDDDEEENEKIRWIESLRVKQQYRLCDGDLYLWLH